MIRLAPALARRIRDAALAAYPRECCGLLIGRREGEALVVDAVAESENLSGRPHDSFEIDMRLRLRLQKELRGTGREVVGHYHSHPDAPAEPSRRDIEQAWEQDMVWLIQGIDHGTPGRLNAFRPDPAGKAFRQVDLLVEISG